MKPPRPPIITFFCWFFIVIGALSILSSVLPFFSGPMERFLSKTLHQSKTVVLAYSLARNFVVIFAALSLMKGLAWSRVLFVGYFLLAMVFNFVLYRQFSWIASVMVVVYIVLLYLPVTTAYLQGSSGRETTASESGDSSTGPQE
jgi:hypothetical protein